MQNGGFYQQIVKFNEMYKLPSNDEPTMLSPQRIKDFQDILGEEVEEANDIHAKYEKLLEENGGTLTPEAHLEVLTDMSDWLGDIVVYCTSEARRWGIPLEKVLGIIMDSNFSKLGANGEPIYDERGKVMKGPGYWKPEPKIREMLTD